MKNGKKRKPHFRTAETRRQAGRRSHPHQARLSTPGRGGDSLRLATYPLLVRRVFCPGEVRNPVPQPHRRPPSQDGLSYNLALYRVEEQVSKC